MSRARIATNIHTVADNPEQAAADLTAEWSIDRRQRWTLDIDTPAYPGDRLRPDLATRVDDTLREVRIRAEQQAREAITGHDQRGAELAARLAALERPRSAGRGGLGL